MWNAVSQRAAHWSHFGENSPSWTEILHLCTPCDSRHCRPAKNKTKKCVRLGFYWLALSREWGNQPLHWYIGDSFPHSLLRASQFSRSFKQKTRKGMAFFLELQPRIFKSWVLWFVDLLLWKEPWKNQWLEDDSFPIWNSSFLGDIRSFLGGSTTWVIKNCHE